MSIEIKCSACGKTYAVKDEFAGKTAKCMQCGGRIQIPGASGATAGPPQFAPPMPPIPPQPGPVGFPPGAPMAAPMPPHPPSGYPAAPSPPAGYGALQAMKCQSCGGNVQYSGGQGFFKCSFCSSSYNSTMDAQGQSMVQIIELRQLREEMTGVRHEMSLNRIQEKAQNVQDKIDFKYVEFYHSFGRKAGSAAVVCWIAGAVLALIGLSNLKGGAGALLLLIGLGLVGIGVALFLLVFKPAMAAHAAESERLKAEELNPVYEQLRRIGASLEGGTAALGYIESTATPLRYCVACHKNITPMKKGGGGGSLAGTNLLLTVLTCGMWLPAWIFIAVITRAGASASRAIAKGCCPQCGTTPLFPARIPNI